MLLQCFSGHSIIGPRFIFGEYAPRQKSAPRAIMCGKNIENLREQSMAMHQINPQGAKLAALDPIWDRVRTEAEDIVRREPELASFIYSTVLHHERLEDSVVHRIAERLDHSALSGDLIRQTFDEALRDAPDIGNAFRADLV